MIEFNTEDIQIIKNNSDIFNISFEIELESNDRSKYDNPFKFNTIEELRRSIKDLYFKQYGRNIEETTEISSNPTAYDNFLNKLFIEKDNIIETIFNFNPTYNPAETKISLIIRPLIKSKYFKYTKNNSIIDVSDLFIEEFNQNFPIFYNRYKDIIEIKNDITIVAGGIEIIINSENKYLNSLDEAIEFLKVFYYDYSNTNMRFFFTDMTGLHINISIKNKTKNDYNVIKGLLFLDDISLDDSIPTVFIGNVVRMNSNWCRSVTKELEEYIKYRKTTHDILPGYVKRYNDLGKTKIIDKLKTVLLEDFDFKKVEKTFNDVLFEFVNIYGKKQLGFNIYNLKESDYVEFRYSGQNISRKTITSKLLYYCYICYVMANKKFKDEEYKEELFNFSNKIRQIL